MRLPSDLPGRTAARRLGIVAALGAALAACAPRLDPAGPRIAPPRIDGAAIVAADGAMLPLRQWLPEGKPRAVILALHGFNDYSNAFADAGAFFAGQGIATYAYDQRGFGAAPSPGMWAGTESLMADLREAGAVVSATHPGVPLYLMGESMGGAVVMLALADPRPVDCAGAILIAPAVWGRESMGLVQQAALWLAAHTIPWAKLSAEGLKITPSDNVEMLRALSRDPLVLKRTRADAVWGLVDLMDRALAAAPEVRGPVLMLYGRNDEIIPKSPSFAVMRELPRGSARRAYYEKGYHMLLRDLDGRAVQGDIAAWIADPRAPLPSGSDRAAERLTPDTEGSETP